MSTAWLFALTDGIVFRHRRSGTRRGRALRFFTVNNTAMLLRLPVLAALVEWAGMNVLVANALTLVLLFLARFLTVDVTIYGRTEAPTCPRVTDPIRGIVDSVGTGRPVRDCPLRSYLPYRYSIPDVATIGSQIELPELAYFRAQWLGNDTEIQLRVGLTGERRPHRRAQVTQLSGPPSVRYQEHLGGSGRTSPYSSATPWRSWSRPDSPVPHTSSTHPEAGPSCSTARTQAGTLRTTCCATA